MFEAPTSKFRGNYSSNQGQNKQKVLRKIPNTCDKFNSGSCTFFKCKFKHICNVCGKGKHSAMQCRSNQAHNVNSGNQNVHNIQTAVNTTSTSATNAQIKKQ